MAGLLELRRRRNKVENRFVIIKCKSIAEKLIIESSLGSGFCQIIWFLDCAIFY